MVIPEHPDPQGFKKNRKEKKKKQILTVFLFTIIIISAAAAWFYFYHLPPSDQHAPSLQIRETPESTSSKEKITDNSTTPDVLENQPHLRYPVNQKKITSDEQTVDPTAETSRIAQPLPAEQVEQKENNQYKKACAQLSSFFKHLDQQQYIQNFQLDAPAQQYFLSLAAKLLNNPPVVSRESDDLYTLYKNMAHFFRVTGGRDIIILKTVLEYEQDNMEDTAASLFSLSQTTDLNDIMPQPAMLISLYDYAGFFLNTIGGRSYLFRRDSRTRLLVSYYAVLLIDQANRKSSNHHGIDIKPVLPMLINEIEVSGQLIYKERYLDTLYALKEKYQ